MTVPADIRSGPAYLHDLCQRLLSNRRLILASNRGPVEYVLGDGGDVQASRGSGGVVTALSAITQHADLTWIACVMTDGERRAAALAGDQLIRSPVPGQAPQLRYVRPSESAYHQYYNVFCNPLLWFLQHDLWNALDTPNIDRSMYHAWENGYVVVNQAFADAIVADSVGDDALPCIMLHDYHLYLVAGMVRRRLPHAIIQHFVHIPWPAAASWQLLPAAIRTSLLEHLLANNVIGFQTGRDVRNFLQTCETYLASAAVDYGNATVWFAGRLTGVHAYPISIDAEEIRRLARSPRVREYEEGLRPVCGEQTIIRVDRMEPSKNIVRGFEAYELLLRRHPEHAGRVKFLAFLVPSRTDVRQYQDYAEEAFQVMDAINQRYGRDGWKPVELFYENNYLQAIAAMKLYDVLLVNAVIDGMNLVAKEGPTVNTRDGVLVLSESVGAWEGLNRDALSILPSDVEGTYRALQQGLTMPKEDRSRRAEGMRSTVEANDITQWLSHQFEDLLALR